MQSLCCPIGEGLCQWRLQLLHLVTGGRLWWNTYVASPVLLINIGEIVSPRKQLIWISYWLVWGQVVSLLSQFHCTLKFTRRNGLSCHQMFWHTEEELGHLDETWSLWYPQRVHGWSKAWPIRKHHQSLPIQLTRWLPAHKMNTTISTAVQGQSLSFLFPLTAQSASDSWTARKLPTLCGNLSFPT